MSLCLFFPCSEGLIFHTPPTHDWATVTGTKFRFVSEQPQSLQIWECILAQDHIKDLDFFLPLQRRKHTVQGEFVWLHYKTDKDALIAKCCTHRGNFHPHHGANGHTDLAAWIIRQYFFHVELWTIFFGSLQFNDTLFTLDNRNQSATPAPKKKEKLLDLFINGCLFQMLRSLVRSDVGHGAEYLTLLGDLLGEVTCRKICAIFPPKFWEVQRQPRCLLYTTLWWERSHCIVPMQPQIAIPTG